MKFFLLLPLVVLMVTAVCARGGEVIHIERWGRRIQLDGFLLEWASADARVLAGDSSILADFMHTPEGVAGYLAFDTSGVAWCDTVRLRWFAATDTTRTLFDIPVLAKREHGYGRSSFDGEYGVVEFVLPWDRIVDASEPQYRLALYVLRPCTDTIGPLWFAGTRRTDAPPFLSGRLVMRGTGVVLLLGVYLVLLRRIRRRRPHPRG